MLSCQTKLPGLLYSTAAPIVLMPQYVLKPHFSVAFSIPVRMIVVVMGVFDCCVSCDASYRASNLAPTAFACFHHGLGPPWGLGERKNRGRAVRSGHGEAQVELGRLGQEGRMRRVERSCHGRLGRLVHRDREPACVLHVHREGMGVDSYVRSHSGRKRAGW